jgi:hypothetical protein
MKEVPETREPRHVAISGHVPLELANEVRRLAGEGNRSVSREVAAALRAHVEREVPAERRGRSPDPEGAVEAAAAQRGQAV